MLGESNCCCVNCEAEKNLKNCSHINLKIRQIADALWTYRKLRKCVFIKEIFFFSIELCLVNQLGNYCLSAHFTLSFPVLW